MGDPLRPQGRSLVHGDTLECGGGRADRGQKVDIVGVHDLIVRVREASDSAGRT